ATARARNVLISLTGDQVYWSGGFDEMRISSTSSPQDLKALVSTAIDAIKMVEVLTGGVSDRAERNDVLAHEALVLLKELEAQKRNGHALRLPAWAEPTAPILRGATCLDQAAYTFQPTDEHIFGISDPLLGSSRRRALR